MTETEKRVPDLRFKGFIEDWEQRKLGEVGELNRGKSKHRPRNDAKLFGGSYPFIQTGDVAKAGLYLTNYGQTYSDFGIQQSKLWNEGTLLITIAANIAETSILGIKAAFPDSVIAFESDDVDMVFVKNVIDKISDMLKRTAETSSQANLNLAKLSELKIDLPSIGEQIKIGAFFKQLDDTIALHQRKLTLLEQLKQTYQLGMFPHNGGSIPALRFAGFSEPWEQRKLNDLYEKGGSGGTPQSTNKSYYMGDIPFLGISDISASNGYIYDTEKHISEKGLNNSSAWIVPKEAISLAMYASVGKVAILKTEAATSQAFYNMVFKKISTRNFIFQYLLKIESTNGWNRLISTGTQANLNAQKVRDLEIMIPSLEEQDKIGTFFNRIDHTIDLHQKKISHIQDLKKALLQKMFI